MLSLLISILSSASCKLSSTNKEVAKLSETKRIGVTYRVVVVPAGGRYFQFETSGSIPDKVVYGEKEIPFECLDERCRFSIAGEPDELIETETKQVVFSPGDKILVTINGKEHSILPEKFSEVGEKDPY